MEILFLLLAFLTPTIIDLLFQYYIHKKTLDSFSNCSQCPFYRIMIEEAKGE